MTYTKVNWTDGVTPENAATLGQMDQGIADAHADNASQAAAIATLTARPVIPTPLEEGEWLTVSGGAMVWAPLTVPPGIEYENAWSAGAAYTAGDVVNHEGVEYLAVNPSTGQEPAPLVPEPEPVIPPAITWEGAWSGATTYQAGDVVAYGGRYWLAAQGNTNSTPA